MRFYILHLSRGFAQNSLGVWASDNQMFSSYLSTPAFSHFEPSVSPVLLNEDVDCTHPKTLSKCICRQAAQEVWSRSRLNLYFSGSPPGGCWGGGRGVLTVCRCRPACCHTLAEKHSFEQHSSITCVDFPADSLSRSLGASTKMKKFHFCFHLFVGLFSKHFFI